MYKYILILLVGFAYGQAPADFNPIDGNTRVYFTATAGTNDSTWYNQANGVPDSVIQATASARPTLSGDTTWVFDGGDYFYSLQNDPGFEANTGITYEFWGQLGDASTLNALLMSYWGASDTWYFYVTGNLARVLMIENTPEPDAKIDATTNASTISNDTEIYLVATIPATRDTVRFYLNGVGINSNVAFLTDATVAFKPNVELGIGSRNDAGSWIITADSEMKMVAVHTVERDAAWIANHYQYLQGNIATQQQTQTKWDGWGLWKKW